MSRTEHFTNDLERLANKRAGRKLGWYLHALVFALVNLSLIAMAALGDYHWHTFQTFGWALGLFIHGLMVFVFMSGNGLRERMVARERAHLTGSTAMLASAGPTAPTAQSDPW